MSQENVEIVRTIVARWAEGDYSSVAWADPDIEFNAVSHVFADTRGVEALGRWWGDFLAAFERLATVPEEFIDVDDDRVLVLIRFDGRARSSGISADDFRGGQLFTLRAGRVVRLVTFTDRGKALEAAGLGG